mmetsp:Transcript_26366/g.81491  ORF Transcript_26366/g.81491 Transcript_26366/m.81491 type:complete len:90 (-) Transcript_26366:791-1060(-)
MVSACLCPWRAARGSQTPYRWDRSSRGLPESMTTTTTTTNAAPRLPKQPSVVGRMPVTVIASLNAARRRRRQRDRESSHRVSTICCDTG